jgi:hypothetical protein
MTVGNNNSTAASSFTLSHSVPAGNNRLLVVTIGTEDGSDADRVVRGVTFGGTPLTLVIDQQNNGDNLGAAIFYLVNPPGTSANVVVTFAGNVTDIAVAAINLTGVFQGNPLDTSAGAAITNTASPSTSITTVSDNSLIISTITRSVNGAITSAFNEIYDQSISNNTQHTGQYMTKAAAGAQAMAYSGGGGTNDWAHALASFKPAGSPRVWDGGGVGSNWSTAANWSGDRVPQINEIAVFDATSTKNCLIDSAVNVYGIDIRAGYSGGLGATLTQSSGVVVTLGAGGFSQAAGTFVGAANTRMEVGGPFTASGGTFNAAGGTVLLKSVADRTFTPPAQPFNNLVLNDGLVGYWKFDEGSGTAVRDWSGYGNDGTLGAAPRTPTWTAGATGTNFTNAGGIQFDGSDDYVSAGLNAMPMPTAPQSIAFWVVYPSIPTVVQNMVCLVHDNPVTAQGSGVQPGFRTNGGVTSLGVWQYGGSWLVSAAPPAAGAWLHFAYTYDGTTHRLYFNGTQVATSTATFNNSLQPDTLNFGRWSGNGTGAEHFQGSLDDIRIYNRALGAAEIAALAAGNQPGTSIHTQTLAGPLSVGGDLILNAGTLDVGASNYAVTAQGSWWNHGGCFAPRAGTVTLNGTGAGKALLSAGPGTRSQHFWNLIVNGPGSAWVLNDALVVDRTFRITSASTPMSVAADWGLAVGDGAGLAGEAVLDLSGPATLAVKPGMSLTVNSVDGRLNVADSAAGMPTLTRSGSSGAFGAVLGGQVNINGLNFSGADAAGLLVSSTAGIASLRRINFSVINAAAGARHLTVQVPGLNSLLCPGCTFGAVGAGQSNVRMLAADGAVNSRIVFEDRGTAMSGAGAGEALDLDDDANGNGVLDGADPSNGAIVYWVYTAADDLEGQIEGFPTSAFDWDLYAWYSTYAAYKNVYGPNTASRIYVRDLNGDRRNYYEIPQADGEVIGLPLWVTENETVPPAYDANGDGDLTDTNVHAVYVATRKGKVFKLIDDGTGLSLPGSNSPWSTPFSSAEVTAITSPLILDRVNLYFGGVGADAKNRFFGVQYMGGAGEKTLVKSITTLAAMPAITTAPSTQGISGKTYAFAGSDASGGTAHVYRMDIPVGIVDADNATPRHDVTGAIVHRNYRLHVGDRGGRMHGIDTRLFGNLAGWPYRDVVNHDVTGLDAGLYPISSMPFMNTLTNRIYYGDECGHLYAMAPAGTPLAGYPVNVGQPVRTAPLFWQGVIVAGTAGGKVALVDESSSAVFKTYSLGTGSAMSTVSYDSLKIKYLVATGDGKLFYLNVEADPTP